MNRSIIKTIGLNIFEKGKRTVNEIRLYNTNEITTHDIFGNFVCIDLPKELVNMIQYVNSATNVKKDDKMYVITHIVDLLDTCIPLPTLKRESCGFKPL
jgi:hypothetical protein